jgi:hypothetical protein
MAAGIARFATFSSHAIIEWDTFGGLPACHPTGSAMHLSSDTDSRPDHPDVFVSYASPDLDRAAALHARLAVEHVEVWFDKAPLEPGCDWHRKIEAGCSAARAILPLLTPNWRKSGRTRYETYASPAAVPLVATGSPEEVLTPPLRSWNAVAIDPLAADEAVWQALIAAIRAKLAEPAPERAPRIVDLSYSANPLFTGRGRPRAHP